MSAIEGIIFLNFLIIYTFIFYALKKYDEYKKEKEDEYSEKNDAEELNLWRTKDSNK